ncbi:hypothetical protein PR048_011047 [Dryococelus australis]|uniref:Integrase zinc-binding domain-containing protein n=1 Tax=Dryococelus australis TaxID=614101 RepID=A0ABQ9HKG7_9NEOP|nr:hypothetical protein PR048_011047 [Dryococelus australis]
MDGPPSTPSYVKIFRNTGHEEQLAIYNNVVFKGTQTLITGTMKSLVLSQLHHAHKVIQCTLRLAREHFFRDGMTQDVTEYSRKCATTVFHANIAWER